MNFFYGARLFRQMSDGVLYFVEFLHLYGDKYVHPIIADSFSNCVTG